MGLISLRSSLSLKPVTLRQSARLPAARPDLINPNLAEFRDSALHRAVLTRNEELTAELMQLGADARTGIWPHSDATSAYAIAIDREYSEIVAAIERVEDLRRIRLSHDRSTTMGTAINALLQVIDKGQTAEAIALMEAEPSLVLACDIQGVTPLHLAAWKHDPTMVAWLLDQGASPSVLALCADPVQRDPAESGKTPLDFAAIVAGWRTEGCAAQLYFMENSHVDPVRFHETARLLREKGAELTPRAAVALGDREVVLQLHREGKLVNEVHMFRGGLLSIAVRVNQINMLVTLLDIGLHSDESVTTDDDTRSWGMPLWFASMCGLHEVAELLLVRGADVNGIVYACGDSLCMAADDKIEALLYKHGAKNVMAVETKFPTCRSRKPFLTVHRAVYSRNVDELTQSDLAEILLSGGDSELIRLCLPLITRACDDSFWTQVLLTAQLPDGLQLLIEHGIDPNAVDDSGYTALHHLASDYCQASGESRVQRAKLLLDAGASLTQRDRLLKATPLGWVCRWGRIELVRLYLQRGADAVESDAEPWATPIALASKRGHCEIVQLLHESDAANRELPHADIEYTRETRLSGPSGRSAIVSTDSAEKRTSERAFRHYRRLTQFKKKLANGIFLKSRACPHSLVMALGTIREISSILPRSF